MMKYISTVALFLLIWSGQVEAQNQFNRNGCTDRESALTHLLRGYDEIPVAGGLVVNTGAFLEVFSSEDGASWTIMLTNPDGMTCLLAAGENWEIFWDVVSRQGDEL